MAATRRQRLLSYPSHDVYTILPPGDVPGQQKQARKAATFVDYAANLDIQSRAARVRLTGVICTIGPACNTPHMLKKMIGKSLFGILTWTATSWWLKLGLQFLALALPGYSLLSLWYLSSFILANFDFHLP